MGSAILMLETEKILEAADKFGSIPMSDFQSRQFVVNTQVTDYRRVKQALLEIDARMGSRKQVDRGIRRCKTEIKIKEEEYELEPHYLKKELILIDIDQLKYDLMLYEKRAVIIETELNTFCEIVKTIVPDEASLLSFKDPDPELERQYWITRMAKQASMDLMAIGRISQGNLDSIVQMPLQDQEETIKIAISYTTALNKAIGSVDERVKLEMQKTAENSAFNFISDMSANTNSLLTNKVDSEDI
jgi:hypothetical protein